jgi:hypothetical protein
MESLLFPMGLIPRKLVIDRELVDRLRPGCRSGGDAADASRLTTAATKKQKTTATLPWLQKGKSWSAGDLARESFDHMPRGLAPGVFTLVGPKSHGAPPLLKVSCPAVITPYGREKKSET